MTMRVGGSGGSEAVVLFSPTSMVVGPVRDEYGSVSSEAAGLRSCNVVYVLGQWEIVVWADMNSWAKGHIIVWAWVGWSMGIYIYIWVGVITT